MAQARKKRRRKHRGTQGGSIDTTRRTRPRSRAEARAQAKSQMSKSKSRKKGSGAARQTRVRQPSWSGAVNRAGIGALIFLGLLLLLFKQPPGTSIALAALMFAVYIPMGHSIDSFFYNRRRAQQQRARQGNGRS